MKIRKCTLTKGGKCHIRKNGPLADFLKQLKATRQDDLWKFISVNAGAVSQAQKQQLITINRG